MVSLTDLMKESIVMVKFKCYGADSLRFYAKSSIFIKKDFTDINFNSVETKGTMSAHIFEDLHRLTSHFFMQRVMCSIKYIYAPKFKIMNRDLKMWLKIGENESSSGL